MFLNICAPALIYVIFSLTQIIIDTFKGFYNTALVKFLVMILITYLLNGLCQAGMSIISWIIVFIPFMLMSVIVAILLYVFGLDPSSGIISFPNQEKKVEEIKGGNLIFSTQPQM
jgi:predicted membrane protein